MKLRNENPLDVIRSMLTRGTPTTAEVPPSNLRQSLFEAMDGRRADTTSEPCKVCGSTEATRIRPSRQKRTSIVRCPECGKHTGPGANTVRGSTNYGGSPGSFYDE